MANPSFNLRTLMDSHKLVENNFISWRRNLMIVLRSERIGFTIEEPYPAAPTEKATEDVWEKYRTSVRQYELAQCVMLSSTNSKGNART